MVPDFLAAKSLKPVERRHHVPQNSRATAEARPEFIEIALCHSYCCSCDLYGPPKLRKFFSFGIGKHTRALGFWTKSKKKKKPFD